MHTVSHLIPTIPQLGYVRAELLIVFEDLYSLPQPEPYTN